MEDYLFMLVAVLVMGIACFAQYSIVRNWRSFLFLLPLLFAVATFWLGFISLLFAFALIFIGELSAQSRQIKIEEQEKSA